MRTQLRQRPSGDLSWRRKVAVNNWGIANKRRLYKSGSGVAVGVIGAGPIGTGSAAYDLTGIDIKDVIGIIHNHPGGGDINPVGRRLDFGL